MTGAVKAGRKRTYRLRPWGRPIGIAVGALMAALTSGPLAAFLSRGGAFLDSLGVFVVLSASFDYFAENAIFVVLQLMIVWWWLSFVKYRSRTAFALTGLVLSAYPVSLFIGRNIAFGEMPGADVLLIVGGIVAAHGLAGALPMLALHFAAYRRDA